ncbi:unnamed protein product [Phaeothamnion confervicola]
MAPLRRQGASSVAVAIAGVAAGAAALTLLHRRRRTSLASPKESYVGAGKVSIVIPAYNEAAVLQATLESIDAVIADRTRTEIVLVNAGCADDTMSVARAVPLKTPMHFAASTGGRGPALNAGAAAASGDILLFCHADTRLPPRADALVRDAFAGDPAALMACFTFAVDRSACVGGRVPVGLGLMEWATNLRCRLSWIMYGDQALSMTAHHFRRLGGFPNTPLMEDVHLVLCVRKECRRAGFRIHVLPQAALCSPRRWERKGVLRNTLLNNFFLFLYLVCDVPVDTIFAMYYGRRP